MHFNVIENADQKSTKIVFVYAIIAIKINQMFGFILFYFSSHISHRLLLDGLTTTSHEHIIDVPTT